MDRVEKYIQSDTNSRQVIEREVRQSKDNLWSMLNFMSECAVQAVRHKEKSYIEKGLYANVIEGCGQDYRDNLVRLTKLYHSCLILELNPEKIFNSIAIHSIGAGKDLIVSFIKRKNSDKTLKCMGLKTTFEPHFDFVQVPWNGDYFKQNKYSEPTDQKLMTFKNRFLNLFRISYYNFCLQRKSHPHKLSTSPIFAAFQRLFLLLLLPD